MPEYHWYEGDVLHMDCQRPAHRFRPASRILTLSFAAALRSLSMPRIAGNGEPVPSRAQQ